MKNRKIAMVTGGAGFMGSNFIRSIIKEKGNKVTNELLDFTKSLNDLDLDSIVIFQSDNEKIRAKKMGIKDLERKYNINDIIKGDVIFCATGVTDGDLAKGVKDLGNEYEVNTFVLHKNKKVNKK